MIGGLGVSSLTGRQSIGHVLFISSVFMTACCTVGVRRAGIDGLHAAAIAAVVSLLFYLPIYFVFFEDDLFAKPAADLVFQALYQGVLTAAICLAPMAALSDFLGASRRRVRCTWPDNNSVDGYSRSWRVAIERRMGRHHYHYGRRLSCQWRPSADTQVAPVRVKGGGRSRCKPVRAACRGGSPLYTLPSHLVQSTAESSS